MILKQSGTLKQSGKLALYGLAAALLMGSVAASAAKPPQEWDGLQRVQKGKLDNVYLRPGINLTGYTAIRIMPVDVEFDKNWDPNSNVRSMTRKLSSKDIERIRTELGVVFTDEFSKILSKRGYRISQTSGDDVLVLKAGLLNVYITAPDTMSAGRTRSYVMDAGHMTVMMQLHDSVTGQLLARGVETRRGDNMGHMQYSSSVTNTAEARAMFARWAKALTGGLEAMGAVPAAKPEG